MPEPAKPGKLQRRYGIDFFLVLTFRTLGLVGGFLFCVVFWNPDFPWISFGCLVAGFLFPITPLFRRFVRDRRAYTERRVPPGKD